MANKTVPSILGEKVKKMSMWLSCVRCDTVIPFDSTFLSQTCRELRSKATAANRSRAVHFSGLWDASLFPAATLFLTHFRLICNSVLQFRDCSHTHRGPRCSGTETQHASSSPCGRGSLSHILTPTDNKSPVTEVGKV